MGLSGLLAVRRIADGLRMSVRLQDDTVPIPIQSQCQNGYCVDLGIAKLVSLILAREPNPRFAQKKLSERRILHRRATGRKKGS